MTFDNLFVQNDILESALQASVKRNDVIQNNIANADVPGYKKKKVLFEDALKKAIGNFKETGRLDLSSVTPTTVVQYKNYNYRMDKNNVDIEVEMVDLYQNAVKYDVMAQGVINNYKRINLAVSK